MQNTKKLLFIAILAVAALAASDSNCAAGLKKIRTRDKWNKNSFRDIYVNPNGTMLDVKRAFEVAEDWFPNQEKVFDINGIEYDDNHPVKSVDIVYIGLYPNPTAAQEAPPPAYYAGPAAPAPRAAIPGKKYTIGDFVRVTVKGERRIGRVSGYVEAIGGYTVDTGDKDRDFMENDMSPEPCRK